MTTLWKYIAHHPPSHYTQPAIIYRQVYLFICCFTRPPWNMSSLRSGPQLLTCNRSRAISHEL